MESVFWIGVVGCLYSYLVYPVVLMLFPKSRDGGSRTVAPVPVMSIIIAGHNEEARIVPKLENTLALSYPRDRLEIIVASDASSDGMDGIVLGYQERGVRLVRSEVRKGKEHAQLLAIAHAHGEILVFTDTGTEIPGEALMRLADRFSDPRIGAVSSEDRFVSRDGSLVGEGAYVKYEMWLRRLESQHAGLVGLSGSFFAARRAVCETWDAETPSDFNAAIGCARKGLVAVTEPGVVGYYADIKDARKEYRRKLRTVLRGIVGLARHRETLNPFTYGLFSVQIWSHKVMRWLVPWFMLVTFASSLFLWRSGVFFRFAALAQLIFYTVVAAAFMAPWLRKSVFLRIGYYFVQVNIAIAHASLLFLAGRRMTMWEPSKR
ncbi:MAG: glycosyltransferase family 2 protein [Acidiferrobacterales bacterium]